MTFDTKFTMALAGCSGSCSANRWHTLSVALPCFLATNPNTLQGQQRGGSENRQASPRFVKQKRYRRNQKHRSDSTCSDGQGPVWPLTQWSRHASWPRSTQVAQDGQNQGRTFPLPSVPSLFLLYSFPRPSTLPGPRPALFAVRDTLLTLGMRLIQFNTSVLLPGFGGVWCVSGIAYREISEGHAPQWTGYWK